ncbi:glycoside hydrolase family 55 protein [Streptomyces sp. NBC_01352]|uniref:glycosyl hydrolase family 28-related protein n=1 Tax=Streptomyces sp. NBC_01352 TaxID=2903834 RepID=UPI002E33DEE2|nr:glycosyl hydrolase family 28-related protein [Streptomyces sp. NBC_01352]
MITVPTVGQTGWGTVLNTALENLDTRLEQISVNAIANGADNTGVTNSSTVVQSTINSVATFGGGAVFFPEGVYSLNVTVPSNVTLVGAGRVATQLRRATAGTPVVDMSGPAADATGATHVKYSGIQSMTVNGNGLSGTAVRCYYANNLVFRDVLLTSSTERLVDGVELWDSRFYNCVFESSGGTNGATLPAVHLRNASAASGFGYSDDNVNQIVFHGCRWENFHNGALRIEDGAVSINNPNGIYIVDCKMETSAMQGGSHLLADDSCVGIWVDRLYLYAGGFTGGFATPQTIIDWAAGHSALENVLISNGAVATINAGVVAFSPTGQRTVLRNVTGRYGTAPGGDHIFYVGSSGAWKVENCYSNLGSQAGGTIPAAWEGNQPTKLVTGAAPTDASFTQTPLNGTTAIRTDGSDFYARIGGTWKPILRSGVAVLAAGTVTVSTSAVTANTRIQLTSNVPGGTPGWLRVSARTPGTSFTITSSSGTDTSTVAWQMTEP